MVAARVPFVGCVSVPGVETCAVSVVELTWLRPLNETIHKLGLHQNAHPIRSVGKTPLRQDEFVRGSHFRLNVGRVAVPPPRPSGWNVTATVGTRHASPVCCKEVCVKKELTNSRAHQSENVFNVCTAGAQHRLSPSAFQYNPQRAHATQATS